MDEELTPLGALLEDARGDVTKRAAARLAGISEGRWRQITTGYQKQGAIRVPANPKRETVISMAKAVGADVNTALGLAGFDLEPVTHTAEVVGGGDESPVIEGGLTVGERGEVVDALVEVGGQLVGIGERLVALAEKLATGGTP